jgi:hypothetical protein
VGFCFGIRRAVGRASTSRVQSLRSAWTRVLAVSGSAALAEHRTTSLSAVVATVLLSWTPLLSLETVAEVPFELYQHHLIVTKGSIGPLNGLSLLIDTGTIPSMVDGRIARVHQQANLLSCDGHLHRQKRPRQLERGDITSRQRLASCDARFAIR